MATPFKMMGSSSPMKACGPGDTSCKLNTKMKKESIVSKFSKSISNLFTSNKPKTKKTNHYDSKGGSHKTVRYL